MQGDSSQTINDSRQPNRAAELRAAISDLGQELDTQKTKKAGAMGIGVFLALLAIIGAYDLTHGKAGLWSSIGISDSLLTLLAVAFGIAALLLLGYGIRLHLYRDHKRECEIELLMQELEDLQVREDALKS